MVAYLKTLDGEVLLGTRAMRITEEGGRASGVELADGSTLAASRAVIANLHPRRIADGFLPQSAGRESFLGAMQAFRPGPATMMLHIAADALPDWRAGAELQRFAYVHLAPDFGMMAKVYGQATAGLLPEEPVLVVGQPTAIDPSRAPEGRHVLWVQVRVVPYRIGGDGAGKIAARDWDAAKAPFAERVLDIIERYAPGFRPHILATHVLSPLDLERDDPNLFEGDSLAGSHHLDQNFLFRPAGGWSRWRTPLKDFYMIGASTWPGAGTGAGSGFMLAKMLAGA
jgi:phytoene dehydrogenase-like protein